MSNRLEKAVLKVKAGLTQKEENSILKKQLLEYDRRCMENEAKMKSMEKQWQKEMKSLQVSLHDYLFILRTSCV